MSDLYQQALEDEVVTGSADGFERPISRQLRDVIQGGGNVAEYLLSLRGDRDERAAALSLEAFMDCLLERRAFSHLPVKPPVTVRSLHQQFRRLIAEARQTREAA